jgi:hypothetical protein
MSSPPGIVATARSSSGQSCAMRAMIAVMFDIGNA